MKKVLSVLLAFLIALALVPTAMAQEAFNPADYKIGIAMMLYNHPVHRMIQLGFMQAAEDLGYQRPQLIGTEGTDMNEVYALAEAFAAAGGDAMLCWYLDESCYPSLMALDGYGVVTGVPHFKFDPKPEGLDFNMACDPVLYGKQVAEFIAERVEGQSGSIALCQNNKNLTENAATDSFRAAIEALKSQGKLQGIRVLDVELLGADVDAGTNLATAIIQKNDDLLAVFATMGEGVQMWSNASAACSLTPDDLVICGMDTVEANLALVQDGSVDCLVAAPLYQEAYKTMEYIDIILRGGQVPEWTTLDAPLVYLGGEGEHSPDFYDGQIAEMKAWFGEN